MYVNFKNLTVKSLNSIFSILDPEGPISLQRLMIECAILDFCLKTLDVVNVSVIPLGVTTCLLVSYSQQHLLIQR